MPSDTSAAATEAGKVLSNSRLAFIWRRVSELKTSRDLISSVHKWPLIGQDEYSMIFDAGSTLFGIWVQDEIALASDDSCSGLNFLKYPLVVNPALEIMSAPREFEKSLSAMKERGFRTRSVKVDVGDKFPFYDDDGNLFSLFNPSQQFLKGKSGNVMTAMIKKVDKQSKADTRILGLNLMISDSAQTASFYQDVLGLEMVEKGDNGVSFRTGDLLISTHLEPTHGAMKLLKRSGRLFGDSLIFTVRNIKEAVGSLEKRGVGFPKGIETSGIGNVAYFQDPDGHFLAVWQPSGKSTKLQPINFYPSLERIMA